MNTPVRDLVDRLLIKVLHRNEKNDDVDDIEAVVYLNEASREVFRWFSLFVPWFVEQTFVYEPAEGDTVVTTPQPFTNVFGVALNGKQLRHINNFQNHFVGETTYQVSGFDKVLLLNLKEPLTVKDRVTVRYSPAEILTLTATTSNVQLNQDPPEGQTYRSLFPQNLDDVLVEFAMISYQYARGMTSQPEESRKTQWLNQAMTQYSDTIQPHVIGEYYQMYHTRGEIF